jgi:hypothetical protein
MTANKRTFEVDRLLTRDLLLRSEDNTAPPANLVIMTNGTGGTYLRDLFPSTPTTGFNRITLTDTNQVFDANLPFNNLNIKQGLGILITKQNINNQDYLTFQVSNSSPSSFNGIQTPSGVVYASSNSSLLNLISYDGVYAKASSNSLYIGGTPNFGIITLSSINGVQSLYPTTNTSSITIQGGFGISLNKTGPASYSIANAANSYSLNEIGVVGQSTLYFRNPYNKIILNQKGATQLAVTSTTITIGSNAFSKIVTPTGEQYEASSNNYALFLAPGYGINYARINSSLQISANPTFNIISTPVGSIYPSNNVSSNVLILNRGYGIDYFVSSQSLTIKLASTFISQISTECGVISATSDSIANFRQGKSIVFSTSSDNMLYINSKDFNRVNIINGTNGLITTSLFATLKNKTFSFIQGPSINLIGNTNNNTIEIQSISSILVSGPQYAFSYIQIYSTASYLGQNISLFEYTDTINAAPTGQSNLGFVPVSPVIMETHVSNKLIYIGVDETKLLYSTNLAISEISNVIDALNYDPSTNSISISSVNSNSLQTGSIDISSLTVNGTLVITSNSSLSTLITVTELSSNSITTDSLYVSSIGNNQISTPLITFNYISSQVGINIGSFQPEATLQVGGAILAQNFVSFSDSSLKNFKNQYEINQSDLESLKPWNFTWKADDVEDVGFAAEDVERILPSAVKRTSTGLRMVDYSRLSIISLAALRDTNNRLKSIESTLTSLLERI